MNNLTKFPQLHIATSVVNRIMNLRDSVEPLVAPKPTPTIPDPSMEGGALDAQLLSPTPPVATGGDVAPVVEEGLAASLVQ